MPKVNYGLSCEQRERREVERLSRELLDRMNEKRGREDKLKVEFAQELGVSKHTWKRWADGLMGKTDFETVVVAAMRAGMRLEIHMA